MSENEFVSSLWSNTDKERMAVERAARMAAERRRRAEKAARRAAERREKIANFICCAIGIVLFAVLCYATMECWVHEFDVYPFH